MSKQIFVGGLSWNTTEDGLRRAFSKYGLVNEAKIVTDRDTGRSRGFGFITFEGDQDAEAAIREMDGSDLDGRRIKVNEARQRQPRREGFNNRY